MGTDRIRVSEIFGPTIQGEGALIGEPTVFVRTGGCDYRCSWCDSLHAVDSSHRHSWNAMRADEIFAHIEKLSGCTPLLVSLSGGNPALQPLSPLIELGHARGYRFALETQGSVVQDWFGDLDVLTLSPKPPSSGMETDWGVLDQCIRFAGNGCAVSLKFVVMDETDYTYARSCSTRYPQLPVYLQPCNHTPPLVEGDEGIMDIDGIMDRMVWLVGRVMQDRWYDVRVLPQLHALLWGNKRGV